jgi:hypothetical protein
MLLISMVAPALRLVNDVVARVPQHGGWDPTVEFTSEKHLHGHDPRAHGRSAHGDGELPRQQAPRPSRRRRR